MKISAKFRDYEKGKLKGFCDFIVDDKIVIKGAKLVEGEHGQFIGVPYRKVGDHYRDVITGVSHDFSAKLLEAALAAKGNSERKASIGENENLFFTPHVRALKDPQSSIKALASLTVRESKESEKSLFTVSDIRVIQGEKGLFLGMPSIKTDSQDYPYSKLCFFTKTNEDFLNGLIIGKAMDELGIEKKNRLTEAIHEAEDSMNSYDSPFNEGFDKEEVERG